MLHRTFYGSGVPDNVRRDPRAWLGLATFPAALLRAARRHVGRWDAIISHWALPCALIAGAVRHERADRRRVWSPTRSPSQPGRADRGGRPHLAVLHSADVHLMGNLPLRERCASAVASSATNLLCASGALRRKFLSWIPPVPRARVAGRCHASAMGIDPLPTVAPRTSLRRRLGFDRFTVLAIARLVEIKGLRDAIDAVAWANVDLVIAGDGPERRRLEERAARRGARVRFVGTRTGRAKAELLAAADAFIAPSIELSSGRTEGTPTSVLEAAAAGLPILASATGGLTEIFESGHSAWLFRAGDVRTMCAGLRRLQSDDAFRARLAHHARAVGKSFEWQALAPRIEQLVIQQE